MKVLNRILNAAIRSFTAKPTTDVLTQQEAVLRRMLKNSSNTEIANRFGFQNIHSIKEYQKAVPVHHYDDVKDLWNREANGEIGLTLRDRAPYFATSTGTTGLNKLIPVSWRLIRDNRFKELRVMAQYLRKNPSSGIFTKKSLALGGSADSGVTKGGAKIGTISGLMACTLPFPLNVNMIPNKSTINIQDWNLKSDEIVRQAKNKKIGMVAAIPATLIEIMKKMKSSWSKAEFQFFSDNLELLCLSGVNYRVYKDGIFDVLGRPVDIIEYYAATEGIFGYQSAYDPDSMELFSDLTFFEFVKHDEYLQGKFDDRKLLNQLESGCRYVLLTTSGNGAFSYVPGDVLECVDASKMTFKIKGRTSLMLNLNAEKTPISAVEYAMSKALKQFNATPGEFFVTGDTTGDRPRYIWVLENGSQWAGIHPETIASSLDRFLGEENYYYGRFVKDKNLDPSKVHFVDRSRFANFLSEKKADIAHSKIPRIVTDPKISERFMS